MLAGTSGGVAGWPAAAVGARVDQPGLGREGSAHAASRYRFHSARKNVTVQTVNILVRYRVSGSTAKEISASVEAGVRGGELTPGDRLPAVRELADQLGVSPTTVAAAYGDLRRRGITAGAGRAGTRIRGAPPVSSRAYLTVPLGARDLITGGPDPALLPAGGLPVATPGATALRRTPRSHRGCGLWPPTTWPPTGSTRAA